MLNKVLTLGGGGIKSLGEFEVKGRKVGRLGGTLCLFSTANDPDATSARDFFDEAFDERRLAGAGLAADDDRLVLADGQAQEVGVAVSVFQVRQLVLEGQQRARRGVADDGGALEQAFAFQVVEPADHLRRLPHRD